MTNISNIKIEKTCYLLIWVSAVFYSIYSFGKASYKYFKHYRDEFNDFTPGYFMLSTKRDKSDFEWEYIIYIIQNFYPFALFYLAITELLRFYSVRKKDYQLWQIVFTIFYMLYSLGKICTVILLLQPVLFYFTQYLNKNRICTWFCSIVSLSAIITYKKSEIIQNYCNSNENELYIVSVSLCWMNLKCTSFFLERSTSMNGYDFFSYCLYPPTMFTGPFILYEDFNSMYKLPQKILTEKIITFVKKVFKCMFWLLCGHIALHFIYVNATTFHPHFVKQLDSWSLCGFGYTMGQFFHIKYVVLYGLSSALASFEGVSVPFLPRCIGRIHLYSDMWRYFDQGLYKFLIRHIYKPIVEITRSRILTSLICFTFVYLWHGPEEYILYWSFLNYFGIMMEYMCTNIHNRYLHVYTKEMTMTNLTRIKCILASPLLAISAISNFYFFGGSDVGNIFLEKFLTGKLIDNLILIFILYCCCQVSTEFKAINADKM